MLTHIHTVLVRRLLLLLLLLSRCLVVAASAGAGAVGVAAIVSVHPTTPSRCRISWHWGWWHWGWRESRRESRRKVPAPIVFQAYAWFAPNGDATRKRSWDLILQPSMGRTTTVATRAEPVHDNAGTGHA